MFKINPCMNWHQFRHGSITYIHLLFTCTYLPSWLTKVFFLGIGGSFYLLHFIIFKVHTCTCAYVHAFTKQVYFHSFVKFQNFLTINGYQMYQVYYNCCVYGIIIAVKCEERRGRDVNTQC